VSGANAAGTAGKNLAFFGDILTQLRCVLVVDTFSLIDAELANLLFYRTFGTAHAFIVGGLFIFAHKNNTPLFIFF
jgi:hypothetical protein